jgi:hypothetical protein
LLVEQFEVLACSHPTSKSNQSQLEQRSRQSKIQNPKSKIQPLSLP